MREGLEGAGLAFEGEAAATGADAVEFHQAAETLEAFGVSVAFAGFEHADEVDAGGDLGAEAAAEVLAVRADAEVVVAARAPGARARSSTGRRS